MAEVEAQLVGAHGGACLMDVGAEPFAQRRVQQVRGGVVAHRRVTGLAIHLSFDRGARVDSPVGSTSSAWSSPTR